MSSYHCWAPSVRLDEHLQSSKSPIRQSLTSPTASPGPALPGRTEPHQTHCAFQTHKALWTGWTLPEAGDGRQACLSVAFAEPAHLPTLTTASAEGTNLLCPLRFTHIPSPHFMLTCTSLARESSLSVSQLSIQRSAPSLSSLETVSSTTPDTCQCSERCIFSPQACSNPFLIPGAPPGACQWANALLPFHICSWKRACKAHE